MLFNESRPAKSTRILESLFLFMISLSVYLMFLSRAQEVHTVWEVMHPLLVPTIAISTSLLFLIIFSSEKVAYKLLFVILQSVLIHSLFSVILPGGDLSGQQLVLGKTRRVFDNTILHGLTGWPTQTVEVFIYEMFQGVNLQAALTTVFARFLNVDILYVHLSFVPILWGMFVPIGSFLITRALGGSETASALSSLIVSAFPYATYFGAISVPNSLGFIFFNFSLYFMLKHLTSNDSRIMCWMAIFSFFSFLSHPLTGVMSFSLVLLVLAFKTYTAETRSSVAARRIALIISVVSCASLLPLSFIYLRALDPSTNAIFALKAFSELSFEEIVGLFFVGELAYGFDFKMVLLVLFGPALSLLYVIYQLYSSRSKSLLQFRKRIQFLFAVFLVVLVDYRIMKLFMSGLPINAERLWVFQDLIAAPLVALAIVTAVSSLKALLKAHCTSTLTAVCFKNLSKANVRRVLSLTLTLNIVVPVVLGGWTTLSLSVAYPQFAPLQTTTYELQAARYIEQSTIENYVVIGDIWAIYAGGMIVGIQNPQAFYFGEHDPRGYDLFSKMRREPSPQIMIEAMNQTGTDTTVAYFIVAEPRLGAEEFSDVVSRVLQSEQLSVAGVFGGGKLYIFSYIKGAGV